MYKALFVSKTYFCCCRNAGFTDRFGINCLTCQSHFCFVNGCFALILPQKGEGSSSHPFSTGHCGCAGTPFCPKSGEKGGDLTKPSPFRWAKVRTHRPPPACVFTQAFPWLFYLGRGDNVDLPSVAWWLCCPVGLLWCVCRGKPSRAECQTWGEFWARQTIS